MPGVVDLAQHVFNIPAVRVGIPEKLGGIEEDYRTPDCATVIGLIVGMKNTAAARTAKKKKRTQEAAKSGDKEERSVLKKLKDMFF